MAKEKKDNAPVVTDEQKKEIEDNLLKRLAVEKEEAEKAAAEKAKTQMFNIQLKAEGPKSISIRKTGKTYVQGVTYTTNNQKEIKACKGKGKFTVTPAN